MSFQDQFSQHPILSRASLVDICRHLQEFRNNPFYTYFANQLQHEADLATQMVHSNFIERDITAILDREKLIGAGPAYLRFGQLAEQLNLEIQEEIKKQQTNND